MGDVDNVGVGDIEGFGDFGDVDVGNVVALLGS